MTKASRKQAGREAVSPRLRNSLAKVIEPMIRAEPLVEFIGEIGDTDKSAILGGADALLFPIDWPEPFGLVMIEAMACGTPVIAFGCGSVPEVVEPGLTGFIVEDVDGAIAAVSRLGELRRTEVRRRFNRASPRWRWPGATLMSTLRSTSRAG